jgi:hypothetical protein
MDHERLPPDHNWVTALMYQCTQASEQHRSSAGHFCENCYAATDVRRLEKERREAEMRGKRKGLTREIGKS